MENPQSLLVGGVEWQKPPKSVRRRKILRDILPQTKPSVALNRAETPSLRGLMAIYIIHRSP